MKPMKVGKYAVRREFPKENSPDPPSRKFVMKNMNRFSISSNGLMFEIKWLPRSFINLQNSCCADNKSNWIKTSSKNYFEKAIVKSESQIEKWNSLSSISTALNVLSPWSKKPLKKSNATPTYNSIRRTPVQNQSQKLLNSSNNSFYSTFNSFSKVSNPKFSLRSF